MRRPCHAVLVLCALPLLAAAAAPAPSGLVVHRKVAGDPPVVGPSFGVGGTQKSCPPQIGRPVPGDTVDVWLLPQMAREDAGGVSLILRQDEGKVYVLYLHDHTYSMLRYPPKAELFWNEMRRQVAGAGEGKMFEKRPTAPAVTSTGTLAGRPVTVARVTVSDGFGHPLDVEAQLLAQPDLGGIAFALESLYEQLRGGDAVQPLTGATSGVPLALATVMHGADVPFHRGEELVGVEGQSIPAERFAVPDGWREVPFDASCLQRGG